MMGMTAIGRAAMAALVLTALPHPAARGDTATREHPAAADYTWKNVAIHGGGFVTGIITHPAEPGLMYARTDVGGAYRRDAADEPWVPITDWISRADWNLYGIESIAIDPSDPDRVYLAAGTYTADWGGYGAMLRSADRGRTFERTDMPFKMGGNDGGRSNGERLAVDPNDGRILFFGSRTAGLWTSTDRAATWSRVESFPDIATSPSASFGDDWVWPIGIVFVVFDASTGSPGAPTPTIYAGVSTRKTSLYRSIDGGETWHAVPGQPVGLRPNHAVLASNGVLYLSYGDDPGPSTMNDGAIWKYDTRTAVWTDITPAQPTDGDRFGYGGIAADASDPDTVMATTFCRWARGDSIFRSTDGGATWIEMPVRDPSPTVAVFDGSSAPYADALTPHWMGDIEIDPFDPDHVLFVTGNGIWSTRNATAADRGEPVRWAFTSRGLEETVPLDLVSPPEGVHLVSAISDFDGFRHAELGAPPEAGRMSPHLGTNRGIDFAGREPLVMARVGDGAPYGCYSLDGGVTWEAFEGQPEGVAGGGSVAVSADGSTLVWTPKGVAAHISHDRGATWKACAGLPDGARIVADRVDADRFYALDPGSGQVYASTDGGAVFLAAGQVPPQEHAALRAVPGIGGDLWIAGPAGLYRSTDAGGTFTKVGAMTDATKIGFGKPAPGPAPGTSSDGYPAIYVVGAVGGVEGIYRSDDAGESWVRINDDRHEFGWINAITGDPRVYGRVYLATGGRGIVYGEPR